MPELHGKAYDLYIKSYGEETYQRFCDDGGKCHGGICVESPETTRIPFCHRPAHDVESIFWTLLVRLIRAMPASPIADRVSRKAIYLNDWLMDHEIPAYPSSDDDSRDLILEWKNFRFEEVLHPGLRSKGLGEMLEQLAAQVMPEYCYLDPMPRSDHLHEAFRRILLNCLANLKDVELDPLNERRVVPTAGKKRPADTAADPTISKRQKTEGSQNFSEPRSWHCQACTGTSSGTK